MKRTRRTLAALAMVALISAGCSNTPAGTGSNGGNTTAATHEQAVKFAAYMRDNGVREFPDPNASGEFV
jgi:predicted small secreted protein